MSEPEKIEKKRKSALPQTPVKTGVNLLPDQYYTGLRERRSLRLLALGVVGVLILGITGSFAASLLAQDAKAQLADEQQRGVQLRAERGQFSELITTLSELSMSEGAQQIALYAEVDWKRVSLEFESSLPDADSRTLLLTLSQRLAPSVTGNRSDTSDANPLSRLSPVLIEYQISSSSAAAGEQLLDRLATRMTGYEWAGQIAAKRDNDGRYTFSGIIRLDISAVGTARADQIDAETLASLRESLAQASGDETTTTRGTR